MIPLALFGHLLVFPDLLASRAVIFGLLTLLFFSLVAGSLVALPIAWWWTRRAYSAHSIGKLR